MNDFTTNSDELGRVTFSAPAATATTDGDVWMASERGYASRERRQICVGGDFHGSTSLATTVELPELAEAWLRAREASADEDEKSPLEKIFEEYTAGSSGFAYAVSTHCGYDMSSDEIERIGQKAASAAEFDALWQDEDWWTDENSEPTDAEEEA